MNWIKIPEEVRFNRDLLKKTLPKENEFLCFWKGAICLCEYDQDVDRYYIGMMPACYLGFFKLEIEREAKITHFCALEHPKFEINEVEIES